MRIKTSTGMGAGVVITPDGLVATNAHVVGGDAEVALETADGRAFRGQVLRTDPGLDLALVRIASATTFWKTPLPVEGPLPPVGSEVYVIGHPLGLGWSVTRGIVSGHRRAGEVAGMEMIQTDAAISPGNSGGPMLDARGRLLGVVTSKLAGGGAENLAFAVPVAALREFLAKDGTQLPGAQG